MCNILYIVQTKNLLMLKVIKHLLGKNTIPSV